MKKVIIGIFAHPDDEAFLAAGSFIKWVAEGADLHLICATKGELGQNPDKANDIGSVRTKEWQEAGTLMGARSQTQLGFPDGGLDNNLFHTVAKNVLDTIEHELKSYTGPVQLELVTYENCGVTGHLDHIAISFITAYIYSELKKQPSSHVKSTQLLYICACEAVSPQFDTSFVFMPKGHQHAEIDLTVNVSDYLDQKIAVMKAHKSQRTDAKAMIMRLGDNLAYEHFNLFKD